MKSPHTPAKSAFIAITTLDANGDSWILVENSGKHGGLHALGGKVDSGETPFQALLRELSEEVTTRNGKSWNQFRNKMVDLGTETMVFEDLPYLQHYYELPLSFDEFHGITGRDIWVKVVDLEHLRKYELTGISDSSTGALKGLLKRLSMGSAPCRSCRHFNERKLDLEINALEGDCAKGIIARGFSVYGAASDVEGKAICESYKHRESFW